MAGYTKLFSSITTSTIWQEDNDTRIVWITMLAISDANGYVAASVPGLANAANVTLERCIEAIEKLSGPDKWSRTKEFDGRRITEADGGWVLLNHAKYRAIRDAEDRREQTRAAMQRMRKRKAVSKSDNSEQCESREPPLAQAEASAKAKAIDQEHVQQAARLVYQNPPPKPKAVRFSEFWDAYPVKKGRADAEAKWKAKGYDAIADRIITDVKARLVGDRQWREGYIPHGSTYVNGRGWEDAISGAVVGNDVMRTGLLLTAEDYFAVSR